MRKQIGFSLLEVVCVLSIIAIVAVIIYPIIGAAKEDAAQASCVLRLREVYSAIQLYGIDHPGYEKAHENVDLPSEPMLHPWLLLGYLGSPDLLNCPETPGCLRKELLSSYSFSALPKKNALADDSWRSQFNAWFDSPESKHPVIQCQIHDETHYFPQERDLAQDLNPPFIIGIRAQGQVFRGRYQTIRLHSIAKNCN